MPNSPTRLPRRRWRIAFLLGLGVLVNFFDRVNLSVSHDALFTTFAISDITFGYLSAAYSWTYAACQLPIGVLLDRLGIRRIGRVSTFLWSVASFAGAISPNLGSLFASRLLLGIGEAPTFPANGKAIGLWFPANERSLATSIFDASAKLASAVGVPLIGLFLLRAGWRWSFALTGVLSLLYFVLFYRVYRDPEDDPGLTPAEYAHIREEPPPPQQCERDARTEEQRITLNVQRLASNEQRTTQNEPRLTNDEVPTASLGYLLRQRKVLGFALGYGSYNYVFYLLLTWLPTYLSSALHIDLMHSFLYTGVPWLFATATDLLVGGWLVDALIHRGYNAARVRKVILVTGTACGLGLLGAADAHTPMRALLWISISLGGLAAAAPVAWSIPSLIAPRRSVGTVGGIINFSGQISGITAQILTGYLVNAHHYYGGAFAAAAVYLLIGIAGYLFLLGKIEQVPPPTAS